MGNRKPDDSDLLCWVDVETTGLDRELDVMLEIAVIITDGNLTTHYIGPNIVLNVAPELLQMSEFVREMHTNSGLLKEVHESDFDIRDAEATIIDWLGRFDKPGRVPIAGSTVGFDRAFVERDMPLIGEWFHYRSVDVSSFNEMYARWLPNVFAKRPESREIHRAQEDLFDSIAALRFYKNFALGQRAVFSDEF